MKVICNLIIFCVLSFSVMPSVLQAATGSNAGQGNNFGSNAGSGAIGSDASGDTIGSNAGDCEGICLKNPIQAKSIGALFQAIIDIVLVFAIPIVVFFIILAGFKYVTARGNEETIQGAHRALLYALIGGVLILGARVLIEVISGTVDAIKG